MRTQHTFGPVCWCKPHVSAIGREALIFCHVASAGKEHRAVRVEMTAVQM